MTIRTAVIGVGAMGRNHARVYSDLPGVDLVGVADLDDQATAAVAEKFGAQAYTDFERMLDELRPNAVSIAVPTVQHYLGAMAVRCWLQTPHPQPVRQPHRSPRCDGHSLKERKIGHEIYFPCRCICKSALPIWDTTPAPSGTAKPQLERRWPRQSTRS